MLCYCNIKPLVDFFAVTTCFFTIIQTLTANFIPIGHLIMIKTSTIQQENNAFNIFKHKKRYFVAMQNLKSIFLLLFGV